MKQRPSAGLCISCSCTKQRKDPDRSGTPISLKKNPFISPGVATERVEVLIQRKPSIFCHPHIPPLSRPGLLLERTCQDSLC